MKKQNRLMIVLIALCLVFTGVMGTVQAQVEPVNKKVKRKTNRRVDQKVDKGVDDALDALEGIFKKKNKKKEDETDRSDSGPSDDENVSVEGEEIIVKDENGNEEASISFEDDDQDDDGPVEPSSFIGSFSMEVHSFKKGKEEKDSPAFITFHIDSYKFAMQPKSDKGEVTMVYDRQNKTITNIMLEDKQAMVMKMPRIKVNMDSRADGENEYKITETGNTKKIEGYLSKEYQMESPKEKGTFWITEELGTNFTQLTDMVNVKTNNKKAQGMGSFNSNIYGIKGIVLESHTQSLEKNESHDMYLKNWQVGSVDQSVFSTEGLQVTDLTRFSIPGR